MKKTILWLKATGISNIAYLAIGITAVVMGYQMVAGASFGIFAYTNFKAIKELIKKELEE